VRALIVAIGRFIEPHVAPEWLLHRISELRIEQRVLMFVDEDKKFAGGRTNDVCQALPTWDIAKARHAKARQIFRISIDRLAHVITAIAHLRGQLSVSSFHLGLVRRAMIDGDGSVVWKKHTTAEIHSICVGARVIRAPGNSGATWRAGTS